MTSRYGLIISRYNLVYIYIYIRRPRPLPRQGRRLGPPEVWNLAVWVQDCCLPGFKPSKPFRRLPRQQASKSTTLTATCPCHLFFRGFKTAVCPPSNAPNAPNAPAGLQGNNSYSYMPLPSQGNNSYSYTTTLIQLYMPLPSVFQGVQDCRLPAFKCSKCFRRLPRQQASKSSQQLLQLHALAICFSGGSRLPFARLQMLQTPPQASKASPNPPAGLQGNNCLPLPSVFQGVQDCRLPAFKCSKRLRRPPRQQLLQLYSYSYTCPCHLFFRGFKTAVCPPSNVPNASAGFQGNRPPSQVNNSYSYMPLPSVFQGVLDCRLPTFKCSKRLRRPPRQQLLQLYSYSYTCPCHLFFRGFKTAVCPPSNAPNAPAGLQGNNSYS